MILAGVEMVWNDHLNVYEYWNYAEYSYSLA